MERQYINADNVDFVILHEETIPFNL